MFSKDTKQFDEVDIKMWAIELSLQSLMTEKTSSSQPFQITRKDIVSVIEHAHILNSYVQFDLLPEELEGDFDESEE
jgi:hypothetical protein